MHRKEIVARGSWAIFPFKIVVCSMGEMVCPPYVLNLMDTSTHIISGNFMEKFHSLL
jgi:hypothetical protein